MNRNELDHLLKAAAIPPRAAGYWEDFPGRVVARLKRRTSAPERAHRAGFKFARWAIGVTATCLAIGFFFATRNEMPSGNERQLATARKYFQEVEALFPNQMRGIVFENGEAHLLLSDQPDVPTSSPLFVKICSGKNCRSLVTFSGQRIQINGEPFEVLSDRKGEILLVGNNSVWSSGDPVRKKNRFIQAQPLEL